MNSEKVRSSDYRIEFIIILCIILTTALVYSQIVHHEFVHLDDPLQLTANERVLSGLSWENIIWSFGPESTCSPLTWFAYTLTHQLFGLNPDVFHMLSLAIHISGSLLLFAFFRRFTGDVWKSGMMAFLFALHPINVESVAWVAELNNVLAGFFWMLTMMTYGYYCEKPGLWRYLSVLGIFGLGMMSKPILMTLPFVLLLLDYWPLRRFSFPKRDVAAETFQSFLKIPYRGIRASRLLLEKVPFLAITCLSFMTTLIMFRKHTDVADLGDISLGLRVSNALVSYIKYLKKLFLPYDLSLMYPYPSSIPLWAVVGAVLILFGITVLAIRFARSQPYLITGWLWFLGSLMPFLGIVQGGLWPEMADRYAYITSLGIFQAVIWGVPQLTSHWKISLKVYAAIMPCVILVCMTITWYQVSYWKNSITLFQRVVSVTVNNFIAHNILGFELSKRGNYQDAILQFHESIRINTLYAPAYFNLGDAYAEFNCIPEAINAYIRAIRINPNYADAHINLGLLLSSQGRTDDAIKHLMEALMIHPTSVEAHNNLANIFLTLGKINKAIYHYQRALEYESQNVELLNNLGVALYALGKVDEAIQEFQKALLLNPEHSGSIKGIELARRKKRQFDDTVTQLNEALRVEPNNYTAYYKLAELYRIKGKSKEAVEHYEKALLIKPDMVQALHNLAILYASENELERALSALQTMRRLNPNDPDVYYNIACIYSRQGKIEKALENLSDAINKGFDNRDVLMTDSDLANIRETKYFQKITQEK